MKTQLGCRRDSKSSAANYCIYLAWYFDVRRKYGRVPLLIRDKRVVLAVARVTRRVARVRSAAGSRVSVPPRGARTRLPAALRTRATLPVTRATASTTRLSRIKEALVRIFVTRQNTRLNIYSTVHQLPFDVQEWIFQLNYRYSDTLTNECC